MSLIVTTQGIHEKRIDNLEIRLDDIDCRVAGDRAYTKVCATGLTERLQHLSTAFGNLSCEMYSDRQENEKLRLTVKTINSAMKKNQTNTKIRNRRLEKVINKQGAMIAELTKRLDKLSSSGENTGYEVVRRNYRATTVFNP